MRLDAPFIRLPLRFDAERLAAEIGAIGEREWRPHPQGFPGNSALLLVSWRGDPDDDRTRGPMRPTAVLERCPYLRQVIASFGSVVGRTRLMRLDGNAEASAHVDTNHYWSRHLRVHVPIVTQREVEFLCGAARVHMAAGECWVFDTWRTHNVLNPRPTRRIHLVCDMVGSAALWGAIARGHRATALHPPPDPDAPLLAYDAARDARFETESHNLPLVMSPWELEHWIDTLLAEAAREPGNADAVAAIRPPLDVLRREWHDAWAAHATAASGWPRYAALLERCNAELARHQRRATLPNSIDLVEAFRQLVIRAAHNPEMAEVAAAPAPSRTPAVAPSAAAPAAPRSGNPQVMPEPNTHSATARRFDRPIFLVSPPRSGSTLLFETLAQAPSVWTIGGESHGVIEQIPNLNPARHGFESNRLDGAAATPMNVAELTHGFFSQLRDRDGTRPGAAAVGLRFLEKTPKNSLRIPFFAQAYPDARFVLLHREPRDVVSSMIDAWRSRKFVTYSGLPGWKGPPWSLALPPGWREWSGMRVPEIAARQWAAITTILLDDLEALPQDRWCVADYAALLADPAGEVRQLCAFAQLSWDRELGGTLPHSRHTLSPPDPDKWKRNAEALERVLPLVEPVAQRLRALVAQRRTAAFAPDAIADATAATASIAAPPATHAATPPIAAAPAPAPANAQGHGDHAFRSVITTAFPSLLAAADGTLLVSTYQSGRLILLRLRDGQVNTHFKAFPSPMGIAVSGGRIALATAREIWEFQDAPNLAARLEPPGSHGACYLPRRAHVTGDIRVHEIGYAQNELWVVNTRFSSLCTLDREHSFVPRWRPRFISALEPADRCHLNGMCIVDDRVRFVSALAETDVPAGWREKKGTGGLVIDVASGEYVARGLSMPHSPRWYDGRLWVLESGKGSLASIDLMSGRATTVVELPGFTRGLAFAGRYAFIGLSQVRESVFGGLPLTERLDERVCGIWVVDIVRGEIAGFLRFEGAVQEIFDVQLLAGVRFAELFEPGDERVSGAFVLPDAALREVAREAVA